MAGSPAYARIKRDVLEIAGWIPSGRVLTHAAIGRHLKVVPRHVAYILATLDAIDRERIPWHRVVADGGAIGRHQRRDDQIERLRAEGLAVSPAGIVQDLAKVQIADVDGLVAVGPVVPGGIDAGLSPVRDGAASTPPSRSRGTRGAPSSTVKPGR